MRHFTLSPDTNLAPSNPPPDTTRKPIQIRILSHNVRYATSSPFPGEQPWPRRLPGLLSQLKYHTRHNAEAIICLQEVLHSQLVDILHGLNNTTPTSKSRSSDAQDRTKSDVCGYEEVGEAAAGAAEEEWAFYGVGRDDGVQAGEYSPIFFRPHVWHSVILRKTVWLSPTPEIPGSKGWDAASVRICTVLALEHGVWGRDCCGRETERTRSGSDATRGRSTTTPTRRGRALLMLNTHLDDQGRRSRREAARLILREITKARQGGGADAEAGTRFDGVVLAGDLNSEATSSSTSCGIKSMPEEVSPHHYQDVQRNEEDEDEEDAWTIFNAPGSGLQDLRSHVRDQQDRYGNEMTFTGFDGHGDGDARCKRIDFIHLGTDSVNDATDKDEVSDEDEECADESGADCRRDTERVEHQKEENNGISLRKGMKEKGKKKDGKIPWQVKGYAVLPNVFDDEVCISDHRAIVGDLVLG